ncbi:glycosyltransferase family 4 protein [Thermobifida halotolerans]|uniref:Glycosyltransferase family 4 protein n=1 Tax=Thermobifida halotolerans TaxID=483545 RepID=A0AA97LVF4_9ACTN|nr:glycosyltransferase family 4 protein [Thermobifida halotolerans]UOE18814.1 glycosyltransferase family 4 protein [Thermobifida halotolerans]
MENATASDRPRMRLVLLAPPWYEVPPVAYGGVEEVLGELADRLVDHGHDVTIVGVGRRRTRAKLRTTYGRPQEERIGEHTVEIAHVAAAQRLIAELRPDLVHDHTVAGPLMAAARTAPTLATVHSLLTPDLALCYRSLRGDVRIAAVSEAQRRSAPDLPWAATVHNAVAPHRFPFRAVKEDYTLVLGRCTPDKGIDIAIEAAREAGRRLVIALKCSQPDERDYFDAVVRPLLGSDTDYVGQASRKQKSELLAGACCLLFPVRWEEPFGMVAVEAMACGTPVVGFRRGALRETVRDGVTGVLVSRRTELAEAVDEAVRLDPRACREHVCRRFGGETMARNYEEVYRAVLGSAPVAQAIGLPS